MEKRFENKLIMLKAVLRFLKQNAAVWANSQPLVAAIAELDALMLVINQTLQISWDENSGIVVEKQKLQAELIKRAFELASQLAAMASRTNNEVLLGKVNLTLSYFQNLRDHELAISSQKMSVLGRMHQPVIAEYGMTEDKLSRLEGLTVQYELRLPDHRVSVTESKAANQKLKELMTKAKNLLVNQIDRLMIPFGDSNAEFYAAYLNARKIVDYGTRYEKPEDSEKPEDPGKKI